MSLRWRATDVPLRRRIDFADLIDGAARDHFPRRDTSMEKLARLKPVSLLDKQPFEQVRRSREASMLDRQAQMRNARFEIVFEACDRRWQRGRVVGSDRDAIGRWEGGRTSGSGTRLFVRTMSTPCGPRPG
jgi:hypothetical protein